jgi:hypothetical protein
MTNVPHIGEIGAFADDVLERFVRLSQALTGVAPLDTSRAAAHLETLRTINIAAALPRLLDVWAEIEGAADPEMELETRVLGDDVLRPAAQGVLLLWYTGGTFDPSGKTLSFASADAYFSALVWDVIGAHPPGLSGGYFGHWRYPLGA